MARHNSMRAKGEKSMNSYRNHPKTESYSSSQVVRHGCRLALQSFAFCNVAVAAILFFLMISAPAQANNHSPCADGSSPPCGGGGGGTGITINVSQDMAFGTLAPNVATAGTAVIDPSTGIKTVTGGVFDFGGVHTAAIFGIRGKKNTAFNVMLPGSVILTSGGNSITLNNFTFTFSPPTGMLDGAGKSDVTVGATLQIGANQPAGTYSGPFDITVNY